MKSDKLIVLGVTGSIAAFKAAGESSVSYAAEGLTMSFIIFCPS